MTHGEGAASVAYRPAAVDAHDGAARNTMWVRVTRVENIPAREGREVQIGGRAIALFNLGDRFAAVDNQCPHKSGPLCDGIVAGGSVVCPLHGWKISLDSGRVERPAGAATECVQAYPTRVVDGVVSVGLPAGQTQRVGS